MARATVSTAATATTTGAAVAAATAIAATTATATGAAVAAAFAAFAAFAGFVGLGLVFAGGGVGHGFGVGGVFFVGHFFVALGHGGFAREADAAFFVDAEALDPNFVAHFDDVFGLLDAEVGEFADVDKAVLAREEFDEGAEFLDGDDFAAIDFARLGFGGHAGDGFAGDLQTFGRDRVDVHGAVVFDVNLATGFLDDAFDVLATGPDDGADL